MNNLAARFQALLAQLDARSRRERVIILATLLAMAGFAWVEGIQPRYLKQINTLQQQRGEVESRVGQLLTVGEEVRSRARVDPNLQNQRYRTELLQHIEELEGELKEATSNLVSPESMPRALQILLEGREGLRLTGMELLPVIPLQEQQRETATPKKSTGGSTSDFLQQGVGAPAPADPGEALFRHGMKLHLEGNYPALLGYLEILERAPWVVFWEGLDYQVVEHPRARITLHLFTISMHESWLGM